MNKNEGMADLKALETAAAFGSMVRSRRKALSMRQDQLAMATGVGRRFLIELEAGKPTCQLGRSLLVAEALGFWPAGILRSDSRPQSATTPGLPDLPDLPEEVEEPNGRPADIL
jgi:transcriptional regulator with XRE-family HTH domain